MVGIEEDHSGFSSSAARRSASLFASISASTSWLNSLSSEIPTTFRQSFGLVWQGKLSELLFDHLDPLGEGFQAQFSHTVLQRRR